MNWINEKSNERRKILNGYDERTEIWIWLYEASCSGCICCKLGIAVCCSQKGVFRVLSGMNTMEQVLDNTGTFQDFKPLDEEEYEVIWKVAEIINKKTAVPCTACEYCTHGCPKKIAIPQYFALYNSVMRTSGSFSSQQVYYNNIVLNDHGKASDCIKCGKCEQACPQHLSIREYLGKVEEKFEGGSTLPMRK